MNSWDHVSPATLADHAEGLLGEFDAGVVARHVAGCDECRSTSWLLAALREILAADDPGPMPAQYKARVEAMLAELALAEPMLPTVAGSIPGGTAEVIDLATRRRVMHGMVRRVGTVAAAVVLLLVGAGVGVHTIGSHGGGDGQAAEGPQPPTMLFASFPTAPPGSIAGPHSSKEGPNHWIYTKNKVFLPDGRVLVRSRTPGAPPAVVSSGHQPAAELTPGATRAARTPFTAVEPTSPSSESATDPMQTFASSPAPTPRTVGDQPTPTASPAPAPSADDRVRAAAVGDPYVSQSGTAYTEDSFASQVMDLVRAAKADHRPATTGARSVNPAGQSVAVAQDDPADPTVESQSNASAAGGSAAEARARVLRCAAEIPGRAIAGDEGTWRDKPATIVVVPSDRPDQVVGYVFYGDCTKKGPVTASDYEWKQQVDDPTAQPAQTSKPPAGRAGEITGTGPSQRAGVPVSGTAATPPPTPATTTATPEPSPR